MSDSRALSWHAGELRGPKQRWEQLKRMFSCKEASRCADQTAPVRSEYCISSNHVCSVADSLLQLTLNSTSMLYVQRNVPNRSPLNTVLLEKQRVAKLVNFIAFYGTRFSISYSQEPVTWHFQSQFNPIHIVLSYFLKTRFWLHLFWFCE